eukprot:4214875-Pyramimonas_sp.AAC.1
MGGVFAAAGADQLQAEHEVSAGAAARVPASGVPGGEHRRAGAARRLGVHTGIHCIPSLYLHTGGVSLHVALPAPLAETLHRSSSSTRAPY